jgi:TPR repeat protein
VERSISYVIGPQSRLRDDEAQARVWMKKAAAMGDIEANMWLTDHP